MTAFIVILAGLALLATLGALVLVPYLCAMATGRALSWVFQVEPAQPVPDGKELLPVECWASRKEFVGGLERTAPEPEHWN